MTLSRSSAVFLFSAVCAASVFADGDARPASDPAFIGGTYAVTTSQDCITSVAPGPNQSAFTIGTTPNGQAQVFSNAPATQPPTLKLISTVAHLTLAINPRTATVSSDDVLVTRLDENRGSGPNMLVQRTVRTLRGTFTIDRANDTLVLGTETEQGTMPDGATTFVLTHPGGRRVRTNDFGQTLFGVGSDLPEVSEQVTTPVTGSPIYVSIACDRTMTGHRISTKY